jgi:hypothetical protein
MSNFGRKAVIAAVAFATVGSTVFCGAALAVDKKDGQDRKHVEGVRTLRCVHAARRSAVGGVR